MQTETRLALLQGVETAHTKPGVETAHSKPRAPVHRSSLRRILACVDHSQFARIALRQAVSLAGTFDCALTLLYVLQPPHRTDSPHPTDALAWDIARRQAATYLEAVERETANDSGVRVNSRLEQGHPAERIVSLTGEIGADLVVLGSHGDSGLPARNLGSTAEHVLAIAHRSVLIARSQSPSRVVWAPRRIVVPLDGSRRAESVLPVVARLARSHASEVVLAHVIAEPSVTAILRVEADLALARDLANRLEGQAVRYLAGLRDQLEREGVSAGTLVLRRADERQGLLDLTRAPAADLVVLSAHGSTDNPSRPFGSVTTHLLARSEVSLLVMQDVPEGGGEAHRDSANETSGE